MTRPSTVGTSTTEATACPWAYSRSPEPAGSTGAALHPGSLSRMPSAELFRVREGPHNVLTRVFADEGGFEHSQEFRLVPLGSVGSLTWY
jgi:hypothetical protein